VPGSFAFQVDRKGSGTAASFRGEDHARRAPSSPSSAAAFTNILQASGTISAQDHGGLPYCSSFPYWSLTRILPPLNACVSGHSLSYSGRPP